MSAIGPTHGGLLLENNVAPPKVQLFTMQQEFMPCHNQQWHAFLLHSECMPCHNQWHNGGGVGVGRVHDQWHNRGGQGAECPLTFFTWKFLLT